MPDTANSPKFTLRRSNRFGLDHLSRRQIVHFLHIGKAAGSQIGHIAGQITRDNPRFAIRKHGHAVLLRDLPPEAPYFFSIRQPHTRFLSGFYSRKRQGRPRHDVPWTPHEARAFATFDHANDLAEALVGPRAVTAAAAMLSIQHASMAQVDWFKGHGFLLTERPPLAILRQEAFEQDLATLTRALDHTAPLEIAADAGQAHRNDYADVPPLSDTALHNLRQWYSQDYAFYEACARWCAAQQPG